MFVKHLRFNLIDISCWFCIEGCLKLLLCKIFELSFKLLLIKICKYTEKKKSNLRFCIMYI